MAKEKFKVTYDVKHINKNSALYGLVSFDQSCTFPSLKDAFRFAKCMHGRRNSRIQVLGIPTIERV